MENKEEIEKIVMDTLLNKLMVYVDFDEGYIKVKIYIGDREVDSDNVYIGECK